jgi:hypothetical protein
MKLVVFKSDSKHAKQLKKRFTAKDAKNAKVVQKPQRVESV